MCKKLILALLFSLGLPFVAVAGEAAPRLTVFPPSHLSAIEETRVLVGLSGGGAVTGEIVATVASRDGRVRVDAIRTPVSKGTEPALARVNIPPSGLANFVLGEELTLTAGFITREGKVVEDSVQTELLALPAPADAGWTLVLVDKPAQVYTTGPTLLSYLIYNPKNNPKGANLKLKFKNSEGKIKAKWKTRVELVTGISEVTILVPSSVTSEGRLGGASLLETALMRDGTTKAKDQAILDFDLNTTAAADPASGGAPLRVSFTASTTGGQFPYAYNWSFGDGSTASEQNPSHTYTLAGEFVVVLTVTDALGAKVSDDVAVAVSP